MSDVKTRILLRSDIAFKWSSVNPTLLRGEVGIEYNPAIEPSEGRKIKFKIGDGVTPWNSLGYVADYDSVISEINTKIGTDSVADQIKAAIDALADVYQEKLPDGAEAGKYLTADADGNLTWKAVADPTWANITGDIADNEALRNALDAKQGKITEDNKLSSDFIAVSETSDKQFVTAEEKESIAKIDDIEEAVGNPAEEGKEASGLYKAVDEAKEAAENAQDDVDALSEVVGKPAEGEEPATGLFKSVADEAQARADADTALSNAIGGKVDKVDGKELIETEKIEKLDGIEEGAQVNKIEKITVNGEEVTVGEDKTVAISGLAKESDLSLLQGRVTTLESDKADKSTTYTKTETDAKIAEEIGKIKHWSVKKVETLPEPSAECENTVYLVPKGEGKTGYKEYICINEGTEEEPSWKFEEIGDTDITITGYEAGENIEFTADEESGNIIISAKEDETTVKLAEDLYAYTNIGKITGASQTNPVKVASQGDSLKSVFNAILGTEVDVNPTVTDNSANTMSQSGTGAKSGAEHGSSFAAANPTVTFTVANGGVAQYGLKTATTSTYNKSGANTAFNYPIKEKTITVGEEDKTYNIRVEVASPYHDLISVTAGTEVARSGNYIYCLLDSSNKVTLKLALPAGTYTQETQTLCGQLKAYVEYEAAEYNGETVEHFCTYLDNDYDQKLTTDAKTSSSSTACTCPKGSLYPYYGNTASTVAPTSGLTKSTDSACYTNGVNVTMAADGYIWFAVPVTKSKIQQYALGSWNNMATTDAGTVTYELASGGTYTYHVYRTTAEQGAGSTLQVRMQ